jgi:hypothetical protein
MKARTSIYRQHTGMVYAVADPVGRIDRDEPVGAEPSFDFARQRRASPVPSLLLNTQKWLDALPRRVQPYALCKIYPRIANLIAAMWADAEALKAYFDELLVDRRRGRRGFPLDVFNDLHVLREYYSAFYPYAMGKRDYERRKK